MLKINLPFPHSPSSPSFSCLIPCYNESKRIKAVLTALQHVEGLDQILCVDDGSTDGTARVIVENFPTVHILCMPSNRGKTAAVLAGALRLTSDYLLLVDGDLIGLRPGEFNQAIMIMRANPEVDMLALRRMNKSWITRLARGDVLITGERIIYRKHLLDALSQQDVRGYQLELALNQYALDHHWQVCWFPVSSLGEISFKKFGLWGGLSKETRMFYSLLTYLGFRGFLRQHRFLGNELIDQAS